MNGLDKWTEWMDRMNDEKGMDRMNDEKGMDRMNEEKEWIG